jgi:hypothetical protein
MALPREWLLVNIEDLVEPLLLSNDDWEYLRLMEVSWKLSEKLVYKWAQRGTQSKNAEIVKIANDILSELYSLGTSS